MHTEDKPRFLLAAEELARQRGTNAEEILRRDREAARNSGYPGPDCLLPDEIESFFADPRGLEANRAEHLMNCAACSALLANAGTDPTEIEKILEQVKKQPRILSGAIVRPNRKWVDLSTIAGWVLAAFAAAAFAFKPLMRLLRRRHPSRVHGTSADPEEKMPPPRPIEEI